MQNGLHWPGTGRWLQQRYAEVCSGRKNEGRFGILGYQWRVLRFNDNTRQSTAKVMAAYQESEPESIFLMQQAHCLAVPCNLSIYFFPFPKLDEIILSSLSHCFILLTEIPSPQILCMMKSYLLANWVSLMRNLSNSMTNVIICSKFSDLKSMVSVGLTSMASCGYGLLNAIQGKQNLNILCIGHGGGSLPLFLASKIQGESSSLSSSAYMGCDALLVNDH